MRFSVTRRNRHLSEELREVWCGEVAADGPWFLRESGEASHGHCAHRKIVVVGEADGGSSRQNRIGLVFSSSWR